jgi:transcriptional regulator of heat shock response
MSLTEIEKYLFYNLTRSCIDQKRPIGSKFLAKKIKHKLSAPSLRIYLRKLAKNGYLENVALEGRLPTDKGWYYYLEKYHLNPEIKIPEKFNLEINDLLETISKLTKNVVFFFETEMMIKGLRNVLLTEEKDLAEDLLNLSENIEKLFTDLNKKINILIGAKIKESKTKNLSLIAYRDQKRIFGFLGPKINYYHTNLVLLKKLIKND